jgi:hypothetical protein
MQLFLRMPHKRISKKPSQNAPEDYPGMGDAKRIEPEEAHVDNVGQRRPDVEGGDERIVRHPNVSENERINESERVNEADADGEGYEWERSGAV